MVQRDVAFNAGGEIGIRLDCKYRPTRRHGHGGQVSEAPKVCADVAGDLCVAREFGEYAIRSPFLGMLEQWENQ